MYDKRQTKAAIMESFDAVLAENERMRVALSHVMTGYWPGSIELERAEDWRGMARAMQSIAADALTSPSPERLHRKGK